MEEIFDIEFTQCPVCMAIWTIEEIDEQYCGSCGWPNQEDEGYI